ncbi:hypothetical protein [Candidatus Phytoplasma solani]|uniref:hypothetical protein n=1 Tax=Candidatus Phytoplasma solani TaxID=69896 RepID=UPI0003B7D155|nr:hypothetical protein [Candidatus Phytoplasma solani]CCP88316.1 hypothetical protein, phage-associated [Candidatus Phytoplasma solani]
MCNILRCSDPDEIITFPIDYTKIQTLTNSRIKVLNFIIDKYGWVKSETLTKLSIK